MGQLTTAVKELYIAVADAPPAVSSGLGLHSCAFNSISSQGARNEFEHCGFKRCVWSDAGTPPLILPPFQTGNYGVWTFMGGGSMTGSNLYGKRRLCASLWSPFIPLVGSPPIIIAFSQKWSYGHLIKQVPRNSPGRSKKSFAWLYFACAVNFMWISVRKR